MTPKHSRGMRAALAVRMLLFSLVAVLAAACGKEAVPRAASLATPAASRPEPTAARALPTSASASAAEVRGLGDPSAPIQVVEYGDYQ